MTFKAGDTIKYNGGTWEYSDLITDNEGIKWAVLTLILDENTSITTLADPDKLTLISKSGNFKTVYEILDDE